jgi:hypothetical protein
MKIKLLFTAILFVIVTNTFSQVPNYVPTTGLVGWWPFNGNAIDESINTNNGTVNGATLTTDRFGVVNSAYSFDGVDDYISNTSNGLPFGNSNRTVSCWFRKENNNSPWSHCAVAYGSSSQSNAVMLSVGNNNLLTVQGWADDIPTNVANISNEWHMMTFTLNQGIGSIYYDGILITSQNVSQWNTLQSNLLFGSRIDLQNSYFFGQIDDIGIWNRTLTNCEITDLYAAQLNSPPVNAGIDQTICAGTSVTLSGTGANTYSWNNSVSNGVGFNPTVSNEYVLIGTDVNGCIGTDTVNVTVNNPSTSTLTETALDSYTLNSQTYTQSGTYIQVIPNAAGCDSTITLNLTLNYTGITELKDGFRIYPNPTFDNLTIERTSVLNSNYVLVDSQGRLVLQGELTETITNLSLGKLEYGNYILQLENQSVPIRIVKQ